MRRSIKPEIQAEDLERFDSQASRCFAVLMRGISLNRLELADHGIAPQRADLSAIICKVERQYLVPVARARFGRGPMLMYWIEPEEKERYHDAARRPGQAAAVARVISERRQAYGLHMAEQLAAEYIRAPAVSADRVRQMAEKLIAAAAHGESAAGGQPAADTGAGQVKLTSRSKEASNDNQPLA